MIWFKYFCSEERVQAIKESQCIICSSLPSDNAHVRSRGSGGTWKDIIPLCRIHHTELDTKGINTFEKKHQINLKELALQYSEDYPCQSIVKNIDQERQVI